MRAEPLSHRERLGAERKIWYDTACIVAPQVRATAITDSGGVIERFAYRTKDGEAGQLGKNFADENDVLHSFIVAVLGSGSSHP